MLDPDDSGLGHGFVLDEDGLELGRTDAVPGDIDHVIDAPRDPEVTILVADGAIAREVVLTTPAAPVGFEVALLVAVDAAHDTRPGASDGEDAVVGLVALFVEHGGIDTKEGQGGRAWLGRSAARDGRDHVAAGLGLPPSVDDGAALGADQLVIPEPGLGVDGLAYRAEQAQRGEVMLGHPVIAPLHEGADSGGGGVEDADLVVLDDLPEATVVGCVGCALVHQHRATIEQGAVDHVGVPSDPAHVGRAPEEVVAAQVEGVLVGGVGVHHVTSRGVDDALGFAGRARGVEEEEHVLRVLLGGWAIVADAGLGLMVPDVAPWLHGAGGVGLARVALQDEHVAKARAVTHALVDRLLEGEELPTAPTTVHGDDRLGGGVVDPVADGLGREPTEDDRVDHADAGAGEHRHRQFGDHRHVDGDGVALG